MVAAMFAARDDRETNMGKTYYWHLVLLYITKIISHLRQGTSDVFYSKVFVIALKLKWPASRCTAQTWEPKGTAVAKEFSIFLVWQMIQFIGKMS